MVYMTKEGNGGNKALSNRNSEENGKEIAPGTIEVTARIMGECGEWIEQTIQINSGITVGTFDVTSRNGYLTSFNSLEQSMIQARNEATKEVTERFLKEVGKNR